MDVAVSRNFEDDDEDVDNSEGISTIKIPRKSAPAFFESSTKAAERAAARSVYDESNSFLLIEEPNNYCQSSSRVPGSCGKRNYRTGAGLPVYSKKVTADLDSDDELMMALREKGFTDQQIADRLRDEGRVRYDRKPISTRINRIKAKRAELMDKMLEGGYAEWQYEDVGTYHPL